MGIVRSRLHKRKVSGGKHKIHRKRRVSELGRLPGNTKLGARRVTSVRARGGNFKVRALRLDTGNFAWGTEACTQRARILDVVYNATSNELVRTKTLVKNAIVTVDAAPFKQFWAKHYGIDIDAARKAKKAVKATDKTRKAKKSAAPKFNVNKASAVLKRKWAFRQKTLKIEKTLEDQLKLGRVLCKLTSRPGQVGRSDGAVLEGAELAFYMKKLEKKKK
jgi:small subunit ribosomal protein S8e